MDPQFLPGNLATRETWATTSLMTAVALERLDSALMLQNPGGKSFYMAERVTAKDLVPIQLCVTTALGLFKQRETPSSEKR